MVQNGAAFLRTKMRTLPRVLGWTLASGGRSQVFLGAKWIPRILDRAPAKTKRKWALRILSLSPHYFFDGDNPKYAKMPYSEYLEEAFEVNARSRVPLFEQMLQTEVGRGDTVLDYGCGPGFLAKVVAPHVKTLYAVDISAGAIACAKILNSEPNLNYLETKGLAAIADGSIDLVYSFAVFQHLTDETADLVLENCREKLRPGGRLVIHIQLLNDKWSSETEWRAETSTYGKVKMRYGLHCFGRTETQIRQLFETRDLTIDKVQPISSVFDYEVEDAGDQVIVYASKPLN
jgi:SAM-dependent methyltransferase